MNLGVAGMVTFNTYVNGSAVHGLTIGKNLSVTSSSGADEIDIMNDAAQSVSIGGNATFNLGAGGPRAFPGGTGVTPGPPGPYYGNTITISTGIGHPLLVGGSLTVLSWDRIGTRVDLSDMTVTGGLTIATGAGADPVSLAGINVHGLATIITGAGADDLTIQEGSGLPSHFRGGIVVDTGLGNDSVTIDSTTISGGVWFEGGPGTNTLKSHNWSAVMGWHDSYAHHFQISTMI